MLRAVALSRRGLSTRTNSSAVTRAIMGFTSVREVEELVATSASLDSSAIVSSFVQLVNLGSKNTTATNSAAATTSTPETVNKLISLLQENEEGDESNANANASTLSPTQLSVVCLCIAKGQLLPGGLLPHDLAAKLAEHAEHTNEPGVISQVLCTAALLLPDQPELKVVADSVLLKRLAGMPNFDRFRTRQLVQCCWAAATLQPPPSSAVSQKVFARLGKEEFARSRDLSSLNLGELVNLAWAFTTSTTSPNVVAGVLQRVEEEFGERELALAAQPCTAQRLCNLAAAFSGSSSSSYPHVMKKIVRDVEERGKKAKSASKPSGGGEDATGLSIEQADMLVRAITQQRYKCDKALAVLAERALRDGKNEVALVNVLYALAMLGHKEGDDAVVLRVAHAVCDALASSSSSSSALETYIRAAWCLAALDLLQDAKVQSFFTKHSAAAVAGSPPPPSTNKRLAHELFEAQLAWQQAHKTAPSKLLQSLNSDNWMAPLASTMDRPFTSNQLRLSEFVLEHFSDAFNNAVVLGGITCDIHLPANKACIVIDHPHEYCANDVGGAMLGSARLRHRLLQQGGLRVIALPVGKVAKSSSTKEMKKLVKTLVKEIQEEQPPAATAGAAAAGGGGAGAKKK